MVGFALFGIIEDMCMGRCRQSSNEYPLAIDSCVSSLNKKILSLFQLILHILGNLVSLWGSLYASFGFASRRVAFLRWPRAWVSCSPGQAAMVGSSRKTVCLGSSIASFFFSLVIEISNWERKENSLVRASPWC